MMKYVDTLVNFIKRIVVRREKRGGQCFFANLERADSDNLLVYHLY